MPKKAYNCKNRLKIVRKLRVNLKFQLESVLNMEVKSEFVIQRGIPI